jgi:O-antigen ligase
MSIRITLLVIVVLFFSFYAWRNWFVSLCASVLLMAVVQHPDFPNSIFGIQGFNLWNVLLLSILLAWWNRRASEGLVWDLPSRTSWMLFGFLCVVVIGVLRLIPQEPDGQTPGYVLSEYLVNCVKWVLPGLVLYDACRTRRRIVIALAVILALYFLLSIQVIRWIPLSDAVSGEDLSYRSSKLTQHEIGYNRVTLSNMLAGASWAMLVAVILVRKNSHRFMILGAAGTIALAQALTGGRTGYASWAVVGLVLSMIRWRKLLLLIPVLVVVVSIALPGVRERMLQGFGGKEGHFVVQTSDYEITSGRNIAWPRVIGEILKAPFLGYGREAMITTGLRDQLFYELGESFPHPHQAYLQLLLDNGIIGFLFVMPIYLFALSRSMPLVLDRNDPLVCAVGCAAFCLTLALMVGAFGGQTFYPREGSVGMWAAIGIMFRISVQRKRSLELGVPLFAEDEPYLSDELGWTSMEPTPTASSGFYSRLN